MAAKDPKSKNKLVFVPLGGVGEIGMNLYLYGYGQKNAYTWLIVDMGVTFGGEYEPGIDVILPDIRFLEEERHNIAGLVLTHAHEDHYGAIPDLWPLIGRVPIYATPFTAAMLRGKLGEARMDDDDLPLEIVPLGARRQIGPFDVERVDGAGRSAVNRTRLADRIQVPAPRVHEEKGRIGDTRESAA